MQIKQVLKDVKKEMLNLYGKRLSKLILYGSHVRGEANEGSDIDLLIVLKGRVNEKKDTNKKNDIVYDLMLKYNEDISTIAVSENRYKTSNMPFYLNVRNDGIDLLISGEILTPQKIKKIYCERKLKINELFHKNFNPMKYKKEINILVEKSKLEFRSAELLFNHEDYGGSVSRCYYSMFHSAQAALLTKNIDPFHFQHKTIISKFGELFIKTSIFPKEMSTYFTDTKKKREVADYDSAVGFISNEEAAKYIENGRNFNQTIENHIQKEMKK